VGVCHLVYETTAGYGKFIGAKKETVLQWRTGSDVGGQDVDIVLGKTFETELATRGGNRLGPLARSKT